MAVEDVRKDLKPIGFVRTVPECPDLSGTWRARSEIIIDEAFSEATEGLGGFSHIIVLYWLHRAYRSRLSMMVHPRGRRENPLVGLFATRSPNRPNPVGIMAVRLLECRRNVLVVEGLDAFDGTPVIDIKPYIPHSDCMEAARVPSWITDHRNLEGKLEDIYRRLSSHYGPQNWWPADGPFEMMVGAILTQSAAWRNVEKAIANLRESHLLSPEALRRLEQEEIAALIRACGYYNAKALKLVALVKWLGGTWSDDLERLFALDTAELREELLSVYGIGDETADSIILYAAEKPVFVIDAYTRRIVDRLGLAPRGGDYVAYQSLFMDNLPSSSQLFQEYHALLVRLAKEVCQRRPRCNGCCLKGVCSYGQEHADQG
ncbi:MAG: tRNA (N6-threonylcarbamoyladenosine(37)-N6)-methyltransferase TrmO [Dehalococcoidales bacterium]